MRMRLLTLFFLTAVLLTQPRAGGAPTSGSPRGAALALASPSDTTPSGWDHHTRTYTAAEIEALTPQPKSAPDMLRNIKVVWDRYLLPQDAFWSKATLLRFFAGDRLAWDPNLVLDPGQTPDRDLSMQDGSMVVFSKLTSTPAVAFRSHYVQPKETASWVYHYPRSVRTTGIIEFPFRGAIKWRDVRELFGDGAVGGPPQPPISDAGPPAHQGAARVYQVSLWEADVLPETNFIYCYMAPNQEPSREARIFIDEICFYVQRTAASVSNEHCPQWTNSTIVVCSSGNRPMDEDVVLYVEMKESAGRIPGYCYSLNLEPSLVGKCPPGGQRPDTSK
jgi:hypothetical protein